MWSRYSPPNKIKHLPQISMVEAKRSQRISQHSCFGLVLFHQRPAPRCRAKRIAYPRLNAAEISRRWQRACPRLAAPEPKSHVDLYISNTYPENFPRHSANEVRKRETAAPTISMRLGVPVAPAAWRAQAPHSAPAIPSCPAIGPAPAAATAIDPARPCGAPSQPTR